MYSTVVPDGTVSISTSIMTFQEKQQQLRSNSNGMLCCKGPNDDTNMLKKAKSFYIFRTGDIFSGDPLRSANMLGKRDFPWYAVCVWHCLYGCINKFTLTRFQWCHNRSGTDTGEREYPNDVCKPSRSTLNSFSWEPDNLLEDKLLTFLDEAQTWEESPEPFNAAVKSQIQLFRCEIILLL